MTPRQRNHHLFQVSYNTCASAVIFYRIKRPGGTIHPFALDPLIASKGGRRDIHSACGGIANNATQGKWAHRTRRTDMVRDPAARGLNINSTYPALQQGPSQRARERGTISLEDRRATPHPLIRNRCDPLLRPQSGNEQSAYVQHRPGAACGPSTHNIVIPA